MASRIARLSPPPRSTHPREAELAPRSDGPICAPNRSATTPSTSRRVLAERLAKTWPCAASASDGGERGRPKAPVARGHARRALATGASANTPRRRLHARPHAPSIASASPVARVVRRHFVSGTRARRWTPAALLTRSSPRLRSFRGEALRSPPRAGRAQGHPRGTSEVTRRRRPAFLRFASPSTRAPSTRTAPTSRGARRPRTRDRVSWTRIMRRGHARRPRWPTRAPHACSPAGSRRPIRAPRSAPTSDARGTSCPSG